MIEDTSPAEPDVADEIRQAARMIVTANSAYRAPLRFYERLFVEQESAAQRCVVEPPAVPADKRQIQIRHQMPLLGRPDFPVDLKTAAETLAAMDRLAVDNGLQLAEVTAQLAGRTTQAPGRLAQWCRWVLEDNSEAVASWSESYGIAEDLLAFAVYHSLVPSVVRSARRLAEKHLGGDFEWKAGYCPVCGTPPVLSVLASDGSRELVCGFCRHQWATSRMQCPFCDATASKGRPYFYSDEESAYRVYTCDGCRKYLKTVDTRKIERPIYAPLEQAASLHLDIQALQMGYRAGSPSRVLL